MTLQQHMRDLYECHQVLKSLIYEHEGNVSLAANLSWNLELKIRHMIKLLEAKKINPDCSSFK